MTSIARLITLVSFLSWHLGTFEAFADPFPKSKLVKERWFATFGVSKNLPEKNGLVIGKIPDGLKLTLEGETILVEGKGTLEGGDTPVNWTK